MTEKEYLSILNQIALNYDAEYVNECHDDFCISMRNNIKQLENLIKEHFDNPPLELNDLEIEKPYWDNEEKEWCFFVKLHKDIGTGVKISVSVVPMMCAFQYKENRFYRKQVQDE